MLLLGIYVGSIKPSINHFFEPIMKQLLSLETGFAYEYSWYNFYVLFAVFDKPARAEMLAMKLSSGYYGCLKCEESGQSVQFGNGHHVVYLYSLKFTPLNKPLRTQMNYEEALRQKNKGFIIGILFLFIDFYNFTHR